MPYGDDYLLCNKCQESKLKSEFYKETNSKRGYRYSCKDCESPRFIEYINKPGKKEKRNKTRRDLRRTKLYNFPPELYKQRLKEQNNLCAICKTNKPGGKGQFHADHNHVTNSPRGVLCHNCNVALGNFKDNPEILKSALKYLEMWNNDIRK